MPPTWSSASRTTTGSPFFDRRYPAVRPAGPAPRITVGFVAMSGRARFAGGVGRGAAPSLFEVSLLLIRLLLVDDATDSDARGTAVANRHGLDSLETLVIRQGGTPLGAATPDQLGPGRIPVIRT